MPCLTSFEPQRLSSLFFRSAALRSTIDSGVVRSDGSASHNLTFFSSMSSMPIPAVYGFCWKEPVPSVNFTFKVERDSKVPYLCSFAKLWLV